MQLIKAINATEFLLSNNFSFVPSLPLAFAFESEEEEEEEEDMDDDPDELEAESGSASLKIFATWGIWWEAQNSWKQQRQRTIIM